MGMIKKIFGRKRRNVLGSRRLNRNSREKMFWENQVKSLGRYQQEVVSMWR